MIRIALTLYLIAGTTALLVGAAAAQSSETGQYGGGGGGGKGEVRSRYAKPRPSPRHLLMSSHFPSTEWAGS